MREEFLEAYNKFSDEIFQYCYQKTLHRDIAKELSKDTFLRTWDMIASGMPVHNIRKTLFRTARLVVDNALQNQSGVISNLWSLTLYQQS